jgi:hypothetical protein
MGKVVTLFFVQGLMFNMTDSGAHYWVHVLMPILDKTLGFTHAKPNRKVGTRTSFGVALPYM